MNKCCLFLSGEVGSVEGFLFVLWNITLWNAYAAIKCAMRVYDAFLDMWKWWWPLNVHKNLQLKLNCLSYRSALYIIHSLWFLWRKSTWYFWRRSVSVHITVRMLLNSVEIKSIEFNSHSFALSLISVTWRFKLGYRLVQTDTQVSEELFHALHFTATEVVALLYISLLNIQQRILHW